MVSTQFRKLLNLSSSHCWLSPQCLFMSNFLYDASYFIAYYSDVGPPTFYFRIPSTTGNSKPFFSTHDWPLNLSLSTSTHLAQLFIKWENEKRAFVYVIMCVLCRMLLYFMENEPMRVYTKGSIIMCTFSYI